MDNDNKGKLIIGFDLGEENTQISVSVGGGEPDSISLVANKSMYIVPTVLCVRNDTRDWLAGDEAVRCRNRDAGVFVSQLLEKLESGEKTDIFGTEYAPPALLERFIRKVYAAVKQQYPEELAGIYAAVRNKTDVKQKAIEKAFEAVGVEKEKIHVLSYMEAFMYYAVSQKKELWVNDVALFDFDEEGLKFCQLSANRKSLPITVTVSGQDFSDELKFSALAGSESRLVSSFKSITDRVLYRQIISTIYFTGAGFDGNWADDAIKSLCLGRRVFKGQNLYSKGAAYAGVIKESAGYKDFLFLTEGQIRYSVSIRMFKDNHIGEFRLVEAGTPWEKVKAKTVGILDNTDEVFFTIYHAVRKETKHLVMNLKNIVQRENKTTRVLVAVKFLDRDTAVITVKDLGFGEFYENTYRVWEKVIQF